MNKKIYLIGVGRSTPVFMDIALDCGYEIAGLYHYNDERTGQLEHGYPILGSFRDLMNKDIKDIEFMLTMGDNEIREDLYNQIISKGGRIPSIFHPTSLVSRYAMINGEGVIIGPYSEIQADTYIDSNTIIRTNVIVCHGAHVGKNCFLGPKCLIGALANIKNNVFIGQSSTVVSGKVESIGEYSLVGAGSLVTKSIPSNVVAVGSPAKELKQRFNNLDNEK